MNMLRWMMTAGAAVALVGTLVVADAAAARDFNARAAPRNAQVTGIESPGMAHHGRAGRGRWADESVIAVAADKLGLTRIQLVAELQSGKSIAQVAQAKNVDPATIVDAVVAERQERLAHAVENGRLTQAQADQMLATMRTNIEQRINRAGLPQPRGSGAGFVDENGDGVCDNAGARGRGR